MKHLDPWRRCVLELRVLERTRSGGNKFKVSEIALLAAGSADDAANGTQPRGIDCR